MSKITLKINDETKAGKALLGLISFFKNKKGIEFIEEESEYNPEFVEMVLLASKEKGGKEIDPENLWANIK